MGNTDNSAIREWAQENGVKCAPKGRVPKAVREAYLAAATQVLESAPEEPKRRREVRFDPTTLKAYDPVTVRRTPKNVVGTVVHYVENFGARTPTGGRYVSRRFTISIDGERWVGQVKNGTDIVKLRPESEALSNGNA